MVTGALKGYSRGDAVCYVNVIDLSAVMATGALALAYRESLSDYLTQERDDNRAKGGFGQGGLLPHGIGDMVSV